MYVFRLVSLAKVLRTNGYHYCMMITSFFSASHYIKDIFSYHPFLFFRNISILVYMLIMIMSSWKNLLRNRKPKESQVRIRKWKTLWSLVHLIWSSSLLNQRKCPAVWKNQWCVTLSQGRSLIIHRKNRSRCYTPSPLKVMLI